MVLIIVLGYQFLVVKSIGVADAWARAVVTMLLKGLGLWPVALTRGHFNLSQIVLIDDLSLVCWDALSVTNLLVKFAFAFDEDLVEVINCLNGARKDLAHSRQIKSFLLDLLLENLVSTVIIYMSSLHEARWHRVAKRISSTLCLPS